jgi:hypothetical protein
MKPEFTDEVLALLKKNYVTLWDFQKAWFCIICGHDEEALEHLDRDDLELFYKNGKWKLNLYKGDSKGYKEFRSLLKERGFDDTHGLLGLHAPGYSIIKKKELEDSYTELLRCFPETSNDEVVDKIIDAYRIFQEPGRTQYTIPLLSNFLKTLEFD